MYNHLRKFRKKGAGRPRSRQSGGADELPPKKRKYSQRGDNQGEEGEDGDDEEEQIEDETNNTTYFETLTYVKPADAAAGSISATRDAKSYSKKQV